ncbi:Uncharacterised protein [Mycobacterium tuberculosis]|nr:Uncharacterised protein [Mycobacterium tuberculosis]
MESGQPPVQDAGRVVHLTVAHHVDLGFLGVGDPAERRVVQSGRDEPCLEGTARRVDTGVQHGMKERWITPGLAGPRGREVGHRCFAEEHTEHIACPRNLVWHNGIRQCLGEQAGQAVSVGVQCGVDRVVGGPQRCQPGGNRHRVTRQRAGLIHRPQRRQPLHHLGAPAERGGGHPAAHHLAEGEQVSGHRIDSVPTTSADPEPGHHLVEDEQGAVLGGDRAQRRVEAGPGRDDSHVAGAGLGDYGGDLLAEPGEGLLYGIDVVVGQHDRVGCRGASDPGGGRQAP